MHIVVCLKQVPDSTQIRVHPETHTIMRQGVPSVINPYDLYALEEALRVRDVHGGSVTVLTMGPPMAEESLRKALTYGADRAVLLTDRVFAGSDTLATSYALAMAIDKLSSEWGKPRLVFAGKQTIDGDTGQVGPGIAKRLGLIPLTYVSKICSLDPNTGDLVVERRAEGGVQRLSSRLPVLLTMQEGTNEIRRGSVDDALRAARAPIVRWAAKDVGIDDPKKCGLKGSPTVVKQVYAPAPRNEKAEMLTVDGLDLVQAAELIVGAIQRRNGELLTPNTPSV